MNRYIVQFEEVEEEQRATAKENNLEILSLAELMAKGEAEPQEVNHSAPDE